MVLPAAASSNKCGGGRGGALRAVRAAAGSRHRDTRTRDAAAAVLAARLSSEDAPRTAVHGRDAGARREHSALGSHHHDAQRQGGADGLRRGRRYVRVAARSVCPPVLHVPLDGRRALQRPEGERDSLPGLPARLQRDHHPGGRHSPLQEDHPDHPPRREDAGDPAVRLREEQQAVLPLGRRGPLGDGVPVLRGRVQRGARPAGRRHRQGLLGLRRRRAAGLAGPLSAPRRAGLEAGRLPPLLSTRCATTGTSDTIFYVTLAGQFSR